MTQVPSTVHQCGATATCILSQLLFTLFTVLLVGKVYLLSTASPGWPLLLVVPCQLCLGLSSRIRAAVTAGVFPILVPRPVICSQAASCFYITAQHSIWSSVQTAHQNSLLMAATENENKRCTVIGECGTVSDC